MSAIIRVQKDSRRSMLRTNAEDLRAETRQAVSQTRDTNAA